MYIPVAFSGFAWYAQSFLGPGCPLMVSWSVAGQADNDIKQPNSYVYIAYGIPSLCVTERSSHPISFATVGCRRVSRYCAQRRPQMPCWRMLASGDRNSYSASQHCSCCWHARLPWIRNGNEASGSGTAPEEWWRGRMAQHLSNGAKATNSTGNLLNRPTVR